MTPTKQQVIAELSALIAVVRASNTEPPDWKVHNKSVLHNIRCLELALAIVKEWKPAQSRRKP